MTMYAATFAYSPTIQDMFVLILAVWQLGFDAVVLYM